MGKQQDRPKKSEANGESPAGERSSNGARPEDFQRFEDLMGKIVQVPKSELDEQRDRED